MKEDKKKQEQILTEMKPQKHLKRKQPKIFSTLQSNSVWDDKCYMHPEKKGYAMIDIVVQLPKNMDVDTNHYSMVKVRFQLCQECYRAFNELFEEDPGFILKYMDKTEE